MNSWLIKAELENVRSCPDEKHGQQNSKPAPTFPGLGVHRPSPVIESNTTLGVAMKEFCAVIKGQNEIKKSSRSA